MVREKQYEVKKIDILAKEKINDDSVMDHLLTKIDKSSERENIFLPYWFLF